MAWLFWRVDYFDSNHVTRDNSSFGSCLLGQYRGPSARVLEDRSADSGPFGWFSNSLIFVLDSVSTEESSPVVVLGCCVHLSGLQYCSVLVRILTLVLALQEKQPQPTTTLLLYQVQVHTYDSVQ